MRTSTARFVVTAAICAYFASPAYAHHEAIFGPQSSAVLSPGTFLTAQVFTRATGQDDEKGHETTMVFSGGVRPSKRLLSLAFIVPITFANGPGGASERGFEDALISARYRLNAVLTQHRSRVPSAEFSVRDGRRWHRDPDWYG